MLPIRTVLHPTDFSPHSDYALRMAGALARDYGARLILLSVVPPPVPPVMMPTSGIMPLVPQATKAQVEAKLKDLRIADPKVVVERRVASGDPVHEILNVAKETRTDVIIMGTHGWAGLSRLLMGSVAEGVARKAPCPVLTIRMPATTEKAAEHEASMAPAAG